MTIYIHDALPDDVLTVKVGYVVDTSTVTGQDVTITVLSGGAEPTAGSAATLDTVGDHVYLWNCNTVVLRLTRNRKSMHTVDDRVIDVLRSH